MGAPPGYEKKFASLIKMCADAKAADGPDVVLIHHPEVLGDDYAEIVESLNRVSDAEVQLVIVPRNQRAGFDDGKGTSSEWLQRMMKCASS
jgi:hypothetical protein